MKMRMGKLGMPQGNWASQKQAIDYGFAKIQSSLVKFRTNLTWALLPTIGLSLMSLGSAVSSWWLGVFVILMSINLALPSMADRASFLILLLGGAGIEGATHRREDELGLPQSSDRKAAHRSVKLLDKILLYVFIGRDATRAILFLPHE